MIDLIHLDRLSFMLAVLLHLREPVEIFEKRSIRYAMASTPIGSQAHRLQEAALRLASQFGAEWIEKPGVPSVMRLVYGFYAGQMPYDRSARSRNQLSACSARALGDFTDATTGRIAIGTDVAHAPLAQGR
jgi:hypothetical protein